eukprot:scaffold63650_cov83-Phaeocystis_antarctica.AAC.2
MAKTLADKTYWWPVAVAILQKPQIPATNSAASASASASAATLFELPAPAGDPAESRAKSSHTISRAASTRSVEQKKSSSRSTCPPAPRAARSRSAGQPATWSSPSTAALHPALLRRAPAQRATSVSLELHHYPTPSTSPSRTRGPAPCPLRAACGTNTGRNDSADRAAARVELGASMIGHGGHTAQSSTGGDAQALAATDQGARPHVPAALAGAIGRRRRPHPVARGVSSR